MSTLRWMCSTHSEVVKGGVGQATSCYVFSQLVQHLWVLGLRDQRQRDETRQHSPTHWCVGVCALTCMAMMLRGMSSRCCLMLKCQVFILIMSSNMNSRYKRPSTQTYSRSEDGSDRRVSHLYLRGMSTRNGKVSSSTQALKSSDSFGLQNNQRALIIRQNSPWTVIISSVQNPSFLLRCLTQRPKTSHTHTFLVLTVSMLARWYRCVGIQVGHTWPTGVRGSFLC